MFDSIAPPPISRRRRIFFASSGIAHGAAVAALIVAAMWRVDKLSFTREHTPVSMMPEPPPGNSGGGAKPAAAPPKTEKKHIIKKAIVKVPVQPVNVTTTTEPSEPTDEPPGDGGGGDGKGSGEPTGGGGCTPGVDCIGDAVVTPPEPKPCSDPSRANDADCKPPAPQVVAPTAIEALRIAGTTQIQPPDEVKMMMHHDGHDKIRGTFRVCLDTSGAVTSTRAIRSTGYDSYDDRLSAEMAGWRYRPFTVNGTAVAVCSAVTFVYSMR